MTETQNIRHDAPLKPSEIRTHTVGDQRFAVMHVAGGSFTQASVCNVRDGDGPTKVLKTSMHEHEGVSAYAMAIAGAEGDADGLADAAEIRAYADAIEQAETGIATTPDGGMTPETVSWVSRSDGSLHRSGEPFDGMLPTPEPGSLSALVNAYGEAMAKAAMYLWAPRASVAKAREHAERADALKAEILARFGGER